MTEIVKQTENQTIATTTAVAAATYPTTMNATTRETATEKKERIVSQCTNVNESGLRSIWIIFHVISYRHLFSINL